MSGGRETGLAEFKHGLLHQAVFGDERADADAAFAVTFRHGVDEYHVLLYVFEVACRDVGRAGVDEFAVDFVGKEIEVVFFDHAAYLLHLAAGVEVAGGIVGVADKYCACARVDEFFEFFDGGQRESVFDGGCDGAYHGSCRDGEGHIVGVGRLRHNDFVAGVEAA